MSVVRQWTARIFSSRVRELERELDRVATDLAAMNTQEFEKLSITRITFDPVNGLQCSFQHNLGKIIAAWAFNTLDAVQAQNYVEMQFVHQKGGAIMITVQRAFGETPGSKAERLEKELAALKARST